MIAPSSFPSSFLILVIKILGSTKLSFCLFVSLPFPLLTFTEQLLYLVNDVYEGKSRLLCLIREDSKYTNDFCIVILNPGFILQSSGEC